MVVLLMEVLGLNFFKMESQDYKQLMRKWIRDGILKKDDILRNMEYLIWMEHNQGEYKFNGYLKPNDKTK